MELCAIRGLDALGRCGAKHSQDKASPVVHNVCSVTVSL